MQLILFNIIKCGFNWTGISVVFLLGDNRINSNKREHNVRSSIFKLQINLFTFVLI